MQRELVAFEGGDYDPAKFLRPETVAAAVAQAIATPPDGHLHEVVLRDPSAGSYASAARTNPLGARRRG